MKRSLALILALVLMFGTLPLNAFATGKKPYTAEWERFKVQVNQAPYIWETSITEKVSVADQMTWTEGYQMIAQQTNASYGKPYASSTGRQYSNNVPIPDGYTHVMLTMLVAASSESTGGLVFFDTNDKPIAGYYIAGAEADGVELKTYAIPSGAEYFVTSIWMADSAKYPYDISNFECYFAKGETVGKPDPDKEHYEPVTGVIALPESYTADGAPTKLIMFAHGGHGYVDETHWYPTNEDMEDTVKALLAAGYAVFDCSGYKDTPYEEWKALTDAGNVQMGIGLPQVVEAYYNCYRYILENYNIEPGLYIQGCSQGGHTALTFAKMHPEDVTTVAWMAGHIELYDQGYAYQTLENKRQVAKLLGFSNTTFTTNAEALAAYEHDKADPFDPMKWITTVDGTDYLYGWTVPVKFFYGTADTILPQFDYVKRFHQALNNAGFTCELKWYEGFSHHDVAPAANEQCRNDMLAWFDEQNSHVHNYVSNVIAPTCTEQGYTTYTCACGDSYVGKYVDASGHSYENGTCTVCGNTCGPVITQQPESISAERLDEVMVSAAAQGEDLVYRWYYRCVGETDFRVSNSTGDTFRTVMSSDLHGCEVYCVITDGAGNSATSDVAVLSLSSAEEPATPPARIPGDLNGDGVVNNKDLIRLFRYLSGWDVEIY